MGLSALCEPGGVEGWGSRLCCVSGAPPKASSEGQSPRLKTQKTSSPPHCCHGGPEERATFCRVSRLVPSRTQEQVSELENLLREGLGKGRNGVPGDPTERWQWLQQGKLSPEDHSSLTGIGTIRTRFHGSLPTQVPAEDLGGGMPHPWGCRERVGSGSGVGGPAGRLTMSGEIQGRCVRSFVLLTDCQAAFQIWLSLPGRFNTSWLCAP